MRLQTWKPQKFKETLIGNHKETQKTLKTSGLFHFTRLVGYLKNSTVGHSFLPVSTFPFYLLRLYLQHEGRGKATKVDENVTKWTDICRSTVNF